MSADKSRKKTKKLEEYKRTEPAQLGFFKMLGLEERPYSHTLELYDFIPKYVWGKVERENGKYLQPITRDFECRGKLYQVTIIPASVKGKDGVFRHYFPSKCEEVVEDALRKLAAMGNAVFLDDEAGVTFTLNDLQKKLKESSHSYSKDQLKNALLTLAGTSLELNASDGKVMMKSPIFQNLGLQTLDDLQGGSKTRAFVRFNPLVTAAIKAKEIRLINYETLTSLSHVIARQLFKRMSHNYTQAAKDKTYTIGLSTIIRDFGLTVYPELRNNLRDVLIALNELKEKNVILEYTVQKTLEAHQRNKMIDALFTIQTTTDFNNEMRYVANQRDEVEKRKGCTIAEAQEISENKRLLGR